MSDTLPGWGATFHPDFAVVSALQMRASRHRHFESDAKGISLVE